MLNAITRTDTRVLQPFAANPSAYARFGVPGHDGVDLETYDGQQLYSPVDGVIAGLYSDPGGWGYNLAVDFDDARRVYLCHLSSTQESMVGDHVIAGTPICTAGMTGNTNWPHVHVVLMEDKLFTGTLYRGRIDPEPWLRRLPL